MTRLQTIIISVAGFTLVSFSLILFASMGISETRQTHFQTNEIAITETEIPTTTAEFETSMINLGKINEGEVAQGTFSIQNTGGFPLMIESVKPSTGSLTANWTQGEILPGSSGFVNFWYYSAGNQGRSSMVLNVREIGRAHV